VSQVDSTPAVTGRATEAFTHPEYLRFWLGALVSNSGSWMQRVTVPFVLFDLTGSAAIVGLAGFLQLIPAAIMGPLGGSLADRFSRRSVLLVTQTAMALVAVVLWATWAAGVRSTALILFVVSVQGVFGGLNIPSWQAFVSELVPREVLLNAVTLNSAQFNAARAVGPAVGGVVLATLGPDSAFLINAISFIAVIGALLSIRGRPPASVTADRPKILREFGGTFGYVRARPGISVCVKAVMTIAFFGGPLFALLVVFKDEVFFIGDTAYGFLGAALGTGAVLGAPFIAGRGRAVRRSRLTTGALITYGTAVFAFALSPTFALALVALLVAGAAYLAIASTLNTAVQLQVDEDMRGKVLSLYVMGLTIATPIGSLIQGWLVELIGPRPVVATSGVAMVAITVWLRWGRQSILRMDDELVDRDVAPPT